MQNPVGQDTAETSDSAVGGVPTTGENAHGAARNTDDGAAPGVDTGDLAASAQAASAAADASATSLSGDGAADPELEKVRGELAERTSDLQRVSAEFANYRRRVDREREQTVASAKASVANELLTVLDDLDRAEKHGDLAGPVKAVADKLIETLQRVGLTPFGAEGDAFDPAVHEAVAHETSAEVSGPTVTTVMRRGYRFGERVLRPAMVAVTDHDGSGGATTSPETTDSQDRS